jgi:hypothetical protein
MLQIWKLKIYNAIIRLFLGLRDPHPDPLVTSTDPAPAPGPSIIKCKYSKKNFDFYVFVNFL